MAAMAAAAMSVPAMAAAATIRLMGFHFCLSLAFRLYYRKKLSAEMTPFPMKGRKKEIDDSAKRPGFQASAGEK